MEDNDKCIRALAKFSEIRRTLQKICIPAVSPVFVAAIKCTGTTKLCFPHFELSSSHHRASATKLCHWCTPMDDLHVALFPFLAHGHMIPTLDIARLLSSRGVPSTILTTPQNATTLHSSINHHPSPRISIHTLHFHPEKSGLPAGVENLDQLPGDSNTLRKFILATETLLRNQLETFLTTHHPTCLVADMFFPWAEDAAAERGVRRLVFHGTSFFALCVREILSVDRPYRNVSSDEEPFELPRLPGAIRLTRLQIPDDQRCEGDETEFTRMMKRVRESEQGSYGVIVNSFYELEPAYADFYRQVLGRRAWHIGPVSLCNTSLEEKARRGKEASIDEHECLTWLDSRSLSSVVYICFGSTAKLLARQLQEIAMALEASEQDFIWVVRGCGEAETREHQWLPDGFERRVESRGLIIGGWAPQVLILEHRAVGAFVTHCGWNSTLEGVCAGVPMVVWPIFAEQFYNEKLVTEVLRVGVPVGAMRWSRSAESAELVARESIQRAIEAVMVGQEATEMRRRAKELKEMAWRAIEENGSSYKDLSALIEDLKYSSVQVWELRRDEGKNEIKENDIEIE